jgi:hypothetical protein
MRGPVARNGTSNLEGTALDLASICIARSPLYNSFVITDIDALNIHIAALARQLGLSATAKLIPAQHSGTDAVGARIEVSVANMNTSPPLECSKIVGLADYQDVGIHTFDDFIRTEAARKLGS